MSARPDREGNMRHTSMRQGEGWEAMEAERGNGHGGSKEEKQPRALSPPYPRGVAFCVVAQPIPRSSMIFSTVGLLQHITPGWPSTMQPQLRMARISAARNVLLVQRRLLATPPLPPPTAGLPPPPPTSGAIHPRPVIVTSNTPPVVPHVTLNQPAPSTLPPRPPLPPPRRPRRLFRRFLLYTSLGVLTFYPVSGWLSTHFESYREFFTTSIPGGDAVADYADDHGWETFGYGTLSKKAVEGWQYVTGGKAEPEKEVRSRSREMMRRVEQSVQDTTKQTRQEGEKKAAQATSETQRVVSTAKDGAAHAGHSAAKTADSAKGSAIGAVNDVSDKAADLRDRAVAATQNAADRAKALATDAAHKVSEATSAIPFNFSDGVESIVREAERALGKTEKAVTETAAKTETIIEHAKDAVTPREANWVLPDNQKARPLKPETVTPYKPTFEGQQLYTGPPLPIGFEPPPGYYIAPRPAPATQEEKVRATLPLLGPKVREFAAEEPVIAQLASTIDSLTASLAEPAVSTGSEARNILTRAQDDLNALSKRLDDVKQTEKAKMEKTVGEKTKEFEVVLRNKEDQRVKNEQGLKEEWQKERQGMADEWRGALESELESQREGIEQRLREEVVSQGIELQRRWLRSIKTQVETERGGRLAKLDTLTTSLKQLERITLDNSATLDDNVRLHKLWSALRAVQHKAETGDVAFDHELRALRSLLTPSTGEFYNPVAGTGDSVMQATLSQLEASGIAQSGVKSFAALSSWFANSVSPRIHSASLVPAPHDASVLSHVASQSLSAFMFKPKAGNISGSDVNAVLARAEWCLGEKDLDGAAREVNSLTGWPKRLAEDWLREARRKLEVQQALEVVGTEATLSSLLLV